ncbi:hypothetical protein Q2328_25650, partial [Escherichia coli]|nr:hypothetical protein [Escherichia coli]
RLNWLLDHGKGKHWSPETKFIQLDIEPSEIDSTRPITAPVVGDIYSSVAALLEGLKTTPVKSPSDLMAGIDEHKNCLLSTSDAA